VTTDLNVLIVEDEDYARESLVDGIDWESAGCRAVGAVESAEEALHFLEANQVDIVVSDIRMEGMDGIELARQSGMRYPAVRFIFLTGFGELEYARQALRNRAWDFLLKPTQPSELHAALTSLGEHLRRERREREQADRTAATATRATRLLRRQWVRDGLLGRTSLQELHLPEAPASFIPERPYTVCVLQLAHLHDWTGPAPGDLVAAGKAQRACIVAVASEVVPDGTEWEWSAVAPDSVGFVLWDSRPREFANALVDRLADERRLEAFCGISAVHDRFHDLAQARAEAEHALRDRFADPAARAYSYRTPLLRTQPRPAQREQITMGRLIELESAVMTGNVAGAEEVLHSIVSGRDDWGSVDSAEVGAEILVLLQRACHSHGLVLEVPGVLQLVLSQNDASALWCEVRSWTRLAAERIAAVPAGHNSALVREVLEYVQANSAKDIGIADVAGHCNRNEKHLSRVLKECIGMTFTELLTESRLHNAEVLLSDRTLSIAEVAFEVGFGDPGYFSRVFRQHRDLSPREFRSRLGCVG
jgi:two-component system response regulator YesN